MPVIDIHTHFIPHFVCDDGLDLAFGARSDGDWLLHPDGYRFPLSREFLDPAAKLERMDEMGIDISVLSLAPPFFFYERPGPGAVAFAMRANESLAELVEGNPRLYGLATLPLQQPDAAAAELRRSVEELGLRGAQVGVNLGSMHLDDDRFDGVLAMADSLGVPLMLHPYTIGRKAGLEPFYMTNSIGNPLDTCAAAARLIFSGALDRHPRLRVVLVHGGGSLPYQIGRLDRAFEVREEARVSIERPPSSYLNRLWMDSITHADAPLRFLAELVGPERLVLGTDLPFDMGDPSPLGRLERVGIDPGVLGATAASLLGIT